MAAYDFHIRTTPQGKNGELKRLQNIAASLGFAGLALESPKALTAEKLHASLTIFHRVTLAPRSAARLRIHVNKHGKDVDLFVIHGRSKPVLLAAAEIPAIHMVMIRDIEDFMVIDSQIARAMANQNMPVEICLHGLLVQKGAIRSRLMRVMSMAMDHLERANCPLILTSGAHHMCELRSPQDLEALSYLASVPENLAKKAMNQTSTELVSRIQESQGNRSSAQIRRRR
jgi:RNase P/RNase MRP subunit p30